MSRLCHTSRNVAQASLPARLRQLTTFRGQRSLAMLNLHDALSLVWAVVLAFGVLCYVLLDGFDLGAGILFLAERARVNRDVIGNSIAPVWDGNETWLVFGGVGLYAVFPVVYAVVLPALYPLLFAM